MHPRTPSPAPSSRTRTSCSTRCSVPADRRSSAAGGAVDAVALANQGETVLAWDAGTGDPLTAGHRVAGPPGRRRSATSSRDHADAGARSAPGSSSTPTSRRRRWRWLRATGTRDGVVTTTDTWLVHQLTRRVRHRRDDGEPVARPRPRRGPMERRAARPLRARGRAAAAAGRPTTRWSATTSAFGGELPRRRSRRRPAGRAARRGLPASRAAPSAPTAPVPSCSPTPAQTPCARRHGLTTSVAWRTRRRARQYCLDGQVYTAASAVRWLVDARASRRRAVRWTPCAAPTSDDVLFVPALAGLAAPWWRSDGDAALSGLRLATSRGHSCAPCSRASPPGRGARRRDRRRHRHRSRTAAGRRRSDPLSSADAGAGRPPADARRGLSRRRTPPRSVPRPSPDLALDPTATLADVVGGWHRPSCTSSSPQWSADRAARAHLARWRRWQTLTHAAARSARDRARCSTSSSSVAASSAAPSPASWPGHQIVGGSARGAGRRRRRHEQGQHRDPAHRVRRHAGNAGVTAGAARLRPAVGTTPSAPASRSSAPVRSSWRGPTRSSTRSPACGRRPSANGYDRLRARRRRRGLRAGCRRSDPGPSAG